MPKYHQGVPGRGASVTEAGARDHRDQPARKTLMQEFEGLYSVSRRAVMSHKRHDNKWRYSETEPSAPSGYRRVKLLKNGKYRNLMVHRIVCHSIPQAMTAIYPPSII